MDNDLLADYIESHISAEPPHLKALYRHTHLTRLYPRMCSGHLQGRILAMLSKMISPTDILELGTFTGYSTLCLAEGLRQGGRLVTVEIDDEYEDELRQLFASSPGGDRVELVIGDALELIPALSSGQCWDLVFIDANKRHYCDYYRLLIDHVRPGGYILADNTLWDGKIASVPPPSDPQSRGIMDFNDMIAADERVESVILPLRDGLTLLRKK